jgi:hypothetical protein
MWTLNKAVNEESYSNKKSATRTQASNSTQQEQHTLENSKVNAYHTSIAAEQPSSQVDELQRANATARLPFLDLLLSS